MHIDAFAFWTAPRIVRTSRMLLLASSVSALFGGVYTFILQPLQGKFSGQFEDFNAYYDAAQAVAHGHSPYAGFSAGPFNMTMSGYDYPPFVSWILQPIGHLSLHVAATLWLWIILLCTVSAISIVVITLLPTNWPRIPLIILATFIYPPVTYNLWHGQMNPVVFLTLAIALWAYINDRELICGLALGIGAALKLAPVVLIVLFIRRRWWWGIVVCGTVLAIWVILGILALGGNVLSQYVRTVIPALSRENGWLYNQSWNGVMNRLADHSIVTFADGIFWIRILVLIFSGVGVIVAAYIVRPGQHNTVVRGTEFGVGVVAMVLSSTVAWYPQLEFLIITLVSGLAFYLYRSTNQKILYMVGGSFVVTGLIAPLLIQWGNIATVLQIKGTFWWWPYIQLWSLPALSAAALMVILGLSIASISSDEVVL